MTFWIWLDRVIGYLSDLELLVFSSITLQIFEALQRNPAIPGDKMQHMLQLLLIQGINVLPKPLDDLMLRPPPRVKYIRLQVLQVDVLLAIDDHIQLVRLKNRQQVMRNNLIDAILPILDHLDDTAGEIMLASSHKQISYNSSMYSSRLSVVTLTKKPFYFNGMVI